MNNSLHWCHVVLSTYGSWLPGDPRGFRTRRHKLHVEGDYKNPPPAGQFDQILHRSRHQQQFNTTVIPADCRPIVGDALRDHLTDHGSNVACLAVGGHHAHLLCKLPFNAEWDWLGEAKRYAWYEWKAVAGSIRLWAKKGKCDSIGDRDHFRNAYYYILRHEEQGAYVWHHPDIG
jgi:hypothetical protein